MTRRIASKTVVGRCKGMDMAELEGDLDIIRGPFGTEESVPVVSTPKRTE